MPVSSVGSGSFHDGPVQLLIEVPAASARPQAKRSISGQAEKAMVASSPPHDTLSGGARSPWANHGTPSPQALYPPDPTLCGGASKLCWATART